MSNTIFAPTEVASYTQYTTSETVKTSPQSRWWKEGKFPNATQQMNESFQRQVLIDYAFDLNEVDDFLNDPRLLALASIRFLNTEDEDRDAEKKQKELREMVAFVLNAKASDEMVDIITSRLAKKVYSDDFSVFVSDKNELTANYANEVRSKKLFIDLCKSSGKPKMIEYSKMNYLLKYHKDCLEQNVVPLPVLFKIRN